MKYEGIVFDLDWTLYDESQYYYEVFKEFCNSLERKQYLNTMKEFFLSLRQTSKDIFEDLLTLIGFNHEIQKLKDELFNLYISIDMHIEPYKDVVLLLDILKANKFRTGLLTNGVIQAQKNKIKCLQLADYFTKVTFARQFGKEFEKPDKRSFEEISEQLELPVENIIFVGDNPLTDFKGAKELGGHTLRLRNGINSNLPNNEYIDEEIMDLLEIRNLLCLKK